MIRKNSEEEIEEIEASFQSDRWKGSVRPYSAEEVYKLRGSIRVEHSIAKQASEKLWRLLHSEPYVATLGALTGNQAVEMIQAGLKAIYLSGWQVAADANLAGKMYPDQSLYPSNSVPAVVRRINESILRADQIQHMEQYESESQSRIDWLTPIIADGEAGFGGPLNVYELTKEMIDAGAAGVHYEDQLSSEKKCGHLGGKVLVPTAQFVRTMVSARLAADVMGVPTVIVARTDANGAQLITSDIDPKDQEFITGKRTEEGFYRIRGGLDAAISRAISYAPYCDMVWCETATPSLEEARRFADEVHRVHPGKLLAYNCSPSFNWEKNLNKEEIRSFQKELARMGYKFQFITLAGFHLLNYSMFELASDYATEGMSAYVKLQKKEFEAAELGYAGVKHQRFVGTSYFDGVSQVISGGMSSTVAMKGSTEEAQFVVEKLEEIKERARITIAASEQMLDSKSREVFMRHVSLAADNITRQEYFALVLEAIQQAERRILGSVTGNAPSTNDEDVVQHILQSIEHAVKRGVEVKYLLPLSPDKLQMGAKYAASGAEVRFVPDLLMGDARYMCVDGKYLLIGVPLGKGKDDPTRMGYAIPSENATLVFTAQLEEYWRSKDSKSFQDYLHELVARMKTSDPSVSSAMIADKFNVNKRYVDEVIA